VLRDERPLSVLVGLKKSFVTGYQSLTELITEILDNSQASGRQRIIWSRILDPPYLKNRCFGLCRRAECPVGVPDRGGASGGVGTCIWPSENRIGGLSWELGGLKVGFAYFMKIRTR